MLKNLCVVAGVVASLALVACASSDDSGTDSGGQDFSAAPSRPELAGSYVDNNQSDTADFGELVLVADGTYTAQVQASAVGKPIACVRFPCNVGEGGKWTATTATLRVKPSDGTVRSYKLTEPFDGKGLHLERGTSVQDLLPSTAEPTCESLGGECKSSTLDVTFAANCERDFGTKTLQGTCKAITTSCCAKK